MTNSCPVVAAIPNYNMGEQLAILLPQLADQGYSDIFVLDDASTDSSRDIVETFDHVRFVGSEENVGAGATRNKIIPELGYKAFIHFMDADIDLETTRTAEVVKEIMPVETIGFVGGLALNPDGSQNIWNYGPRQCLRNDIGSRVHKYVAAMMMENPERALALRERFSNLLSGWPDPFNEPTRRPIFWNIEQNLLIGSEVFAGIGGFDESLREHEIQDLAIRMAKRGLKRYFDPAIAIRHKEVTVRPYNRNLAMGLNELRIHRKHGLRNWFFPDGKFTPAD